MLASDSEEGDSVCVRTGHIDPRPELVLAVTLGTRVDESIHTTILNTKIEFYSPHSATPQRPSSVRLD